MTRSPFLDQSRLLLILNSPLTVWISKLFLIQWLIDFVVWATSKRLKPKSLTTQSDSRLEITLETIVHDVVTDLGYVGAMVATREPDDSLPVRAYFIDPLVMTKEEIEKWERRLSLAVGRKIGLKAPIARAYLNDKRFKDNLSVRAVTAEAGPQVVTHHELYSLFTPVVPRFLRGVIRRIQDNLGIRQVVAVPFFLGDGKDSADVVGNLFVVSRNDISLREEKILQAFGRQAASSIENERRLQQELRLNGQVTALQSTTLKMQTSIKDEQAILDNIVKGVVRNLGYVGAMVATRDGDTLPVKAYFVDPNVITEKDIHKWEQRLSMVVGTEIGLKAPIARTYLHDERFRSNLSVRAVMAENGPHVAVDNELFSLFVPVVPRALRRAIWRIQKIFDIGQVIAVPFSLDETGKSSKDVVGNLFVITKAQSFSNEEIEILQTFAQQAAIGIRNAQLYHEVQSLQHDIALAYQKEKQRRAGAEKIAQIADHFSNVRHDLVHELVKIQILADEALEENDKSPLPDTVIENLRDITAIADVTLNLVKTLKEEVITSDLSESLENLPKSIEFKETDIREHITKAIHKVEKLSKQPNIEIVLELPNEDIKVQSTDALTEIFVILIDNAVDAMGDKGKIVVSVQPNHNEWILVSVSDTGPGVPDEYRERIFDDRFTTKGSEGLGYGLFYARTALTWMNGEIWLAEENSACSGANFLVRLPIAKSN